MAYWTKEYFKILYDQYSSSGKSVRKFCRDQKINEKRFYYWIHKVKSEVVSDMEHKHSFIPVAAQALNNLTKLNLQPIFELKESSSTFKKIKIVYPNGVELQLEFIDNLDTLGQLITLK